MYHYLDVKIIANQDVYSNILQIKTPPPPSAAAPRKQREGGGGGVCVAGTGSERSVQKEVAVVVQIYCFLMAVKERRSWRRSGG